MWADAPNSPAKCPGGRNSPGKCSGWRNSLATWVDGRNSPATCPHWRNSPAAKRVSEFDWDSTAAVARLHNHHLEGKVENLGYYTK